MPPADPARLQEAADHVAKGATYSLVTPESNPSLHRQFQERAKKLGLSPEIALVRVNSSVITANALRPEVVAYSTGLEKLLNPDELIEVLTHELGHQQENTHVLNEAPWLTTVLLMTGPWIAEIFQSHGTKDPDTASLDDEAFTRREIGWKALGATVRGAVGFVVSNRAQEHWADTAIARVGGDGDHFRRALEKIETEELKDKTAMEKIVFKLAPAATHGTLPERKWLSRVASQLYADRKNNDRSR